MKRTRKCRRKLKQLQDQEGAKAPYSENAGENQSSYRIENEQRLHIPKLTAKIKAVTGSKMSKGSLFPENVKAKLLLVLIIPLYYDVLLFGTVQCIAVD